MSLAEQIQQDMVAAMRRQDAPVLGTLRMVKSAIKNKEVEKRAPLTDPETQQVLSTLIKQRKDSIEQFAKGGRQDLADKEAAEILIIERYLPKEADEETMLKTVREAVAEFGATPTMKDMGAVMKAAMAKFAAAGLRVDGKRVNELVRQELAGK